MRAGGRGGLGGSRGTHDSCAGWGIRNRIAVTSIGFWRSADQSVRWQPPWQNYSQVALEDYIFIMPLMLHQASFHSEDFVPLSGWSIPVMTRYGSQSLGRY
jgi:hypothetical protein